MNLTPEMVWLLAVVFTQEKPATQWRAIAEGMAHEHDLSLIEDACRFGLDPPASAADMPSLALLIEARRIARLRVAQAGDGATPGYLADTYLADEVADAFEDVLEP